MVRSYRICLGDVASGRLERAAAELGRPVEDLIECAAEEAALEFAKSRGWPLGPMCGHSTDDERSDNEIGLRLV